MSNVFYRILCPSRALTWSRMSGAFFPHSCTKREEAIRSDVNDSPLFLGLVGGDPKPRKEVTQYSGITFLENKACARRYRVNSKCGKLWGCGCLLSHFAAFCLLERCVEFPDVYFKHKLVAVAQVVQKLLKKRWKAKNPNPSQKLIFAAHFLEVSLNILHVFCDISWLEWARELCLVPNWSSFQAA